jgi:hypothetical protein
LIRKPAALGRVLGWDFTNSVSIDFCEEGNHEIAKSGNHEISATPRREPATLRFCLPECTE